mmetsp:Transcript_134508/g.218927  ORF Transcript_134508/g.218927 Transcript_134508/m.218927 type:complete len:130 (-) Transcript_134508:166-555(-)
MHPRIWTCGLRWQCLRKIESHALQSHPGLQLRFTSEPPESSRGPSLQESSQLLQFSHAYFGAVAFSCSMAACSELEAAVGLAAVALVAVAATGAWDEDVPGSDPVVDARRTLSTSTVNLMASAAAFVRR